MSQEFFVYALTEPDTGEVRYIGQTNNVEKRYRVHCRRGAENSLYPIARTLWIRELFAVGKKPGIKVLEKHSDRTSALIGEQRQIKAHAERGAVLLNKMIYAKTEQMGFSISAGKRESHELLAVDVFSSDGKKLATAYGDTQHEAEVMARAVMRAIAGMQKR